MHPFTKHSHDSVAAWGEEKLIAAIRRWLGATSPRSPFGIGDDCAVLPASRGRQLITVDPVIYGRHFDASVAPRLKTLKVVEPPKRKAGIKVADAAALVAKLRNEAKVIS